MEIRGEFRIDPGHLSAGEAAGELEVVVPYTGPETTAAVLRTRRGPDCGVACPHPIGCRAYVALPPAVRLPLLGARPPGGTIAGTRQPLPAGRSNPRWFWRATVWRASAMPSSPASTVLVATRRHLWRTEEEKLARALAQRRAQSRAAAHRIGRKMLDAFFVLIYDSVLRCRLGVRERLRPPLGDIHGIHTATVGCRGPGRVPVLRPAAPRKVLKRMRMTANGILQIALYLPRSAGADQAPGRLHGEGVRRGAHLPAPRAAAAGSGCCTSSAASTKTASSTGPAMPARCWLSAWSASCSPTCCCASSNGCR